MIKLYKFHVNYGRMGNISGIFSIEENELTRYNGKMVYFGEILGKHSDVDYEINKDDFTVLTDDQDFISRFDEMGCESGYNPFDYVSEIEEIDDSDEEETE
jgi:hypothetical protein